jgi:hypothetical protein
MLDAHRSVAVEAIAMRVDGEAMPLEAMPTARLYAQWVAADWRNDPQTAIEAGGDRD